MKGTAGVESTFGQGSRFWIELREGGGVMDAPRTVVLLVEDDPDDVFFVSEAFKLAAPTLPSASRVTARRRSPICWEPGPATTAPRSSCST